MLKKIIINILYYIEKIKLKHIKILNDEETISKIIDNNMSIARYGDGEFNWMINENEINNNFQDNNELLSKKLREILPNRMEKLLVCIPYTFINQYNLTKSSKMFWKTTFIKKWNKIRKYISKNIEYGNSTLTRCYITYEDKSKCKEKFDNLKRIWNQKDLIIVEGKYSRLGVSNDLFDNAKSIKRILCPEKNAFNCYNRILEESLKQPKNSLYLIALGPTATVLAYDLTKNGRQALDIGHIDIEYEWFLRNVDKRIPLEGKYVNEVFEENKNYETMINQEYENSIIITIEN